VVIVGMGGVVVVVVVVEDVVVVPPPEELAVHRAVKVTTLPSEYRV
jgi:hypothetical protein